jgi:hypothetical protein
MPRFTDDHARLIKDAMLRKSPLYIFTQNDVDALVEETGLNRAQIHKWAEHFRYRWSCKTSCEIQAYLRSNKQVT